MPLRGAESHSETISAPCQCRTLGRPLEAVYGPYSTSAPCTRHSTNEKTRSTARRKPTRALTALSSGPPRVAILTVITRQKSHSTRPISEAKEIGCYQQRGRGRGCDPADPHEGGTHRPHTNLSVGFQRYRVVNEPCSGPVGPCYSALLSINKYRPVPLRDQPRPPVVTRS